MNPSPSISATANPTTICAGQSSQLTASGLATTTATSCFTNSVQTPFECCGGINYQNITVSGIPAGATITGITLTVNVLHQRDHEVQMYLVAPGGTLTTPGSGGYDYTPSAGTAVVLEGAQGGNTANFTNTIFSDAGAGLLGPTGSAPYTGTFKPVNAFSTLLPQLNITGANGTWRFGFLDDVNSGYTGIYQNSTLCITYTTTTGGTYSWSPSTGLSSTTIYNPIATPATTTTYTVTGSGQNGCAASANVTVTVSPTPSLTLSSASGTDNQTICLGSSITNISYATAGGATGASISWSPSTPAGITYTAGTITISGTPTSAGTYTYTLTPTGGSCTPVTSTGTITVNQPPTTSASPNPVCQGGTVTLTSNCPGTGSFTAGPNYAGTGTSTGASNVWNNPTNVNANDNSYTTSTISSGGNSAILSATNFGFAIPSNATINGVQVTIGRFASTAGQMSDNTVQLIVGGIATGNNSPLGGTWPNTETPANYGATNSIWGLASLTPSQVNASNFGVELIVHNTNGGSRTASVDYIQITITYTINGTISWYTASSGGSLVGTGSPLILNGSGTYNTNTPGTYTYYAECSLAPGCRTATSFTVNANNTVGAPSSTPTLCINTALSPSITIATTGATGIGAATGLPTGVTATWAANIITISGTATASGTFNYSIPLTGGCGVVNATGTITVTPNNTVTAGTTTTLCINTAISPNITHTTTGATGIANDGVSGANGLPVGVSAHWAANTITISGTATASGTFNYSIPLTGGCGVVNATGTITVKANNTAGAPSSNPTLCINTALSPTITIATTGATGISNDGVSGANGLPAGVSAHWAANTITISGTATTSGTFNYSIPLTGGCGVVNATGTITVTPANTTGLPSSTPTLCINTALSPSITIATTGATGISNDGVSGANGLPAGVSAHWSANIITISGTATASGTFNYSIPLTGGCGVVNATGTITVTPNNTVTAGTTTTLCINTAISPNITHTTTGATGIANDGVSGANGLPVGVSAHWAANTITISGTATASGTFNYSIPLTGGCGVVNATGTITVKANNTAGAPSSNPTLCINTALSPTITIATTGATGISNDGVSGANGLPAGVSAHWAANTITISGTATTSGTFNYSIPLTGGCGVVNATGTITVTPANTTGLPSSTPTLCINTALSPSITIATTGATGISNDGVSGANGLPAGVSAHWSANIITISGTATASGTFNYSIPLTGGCGVVNATGTITVTPNNTVTAGTTTTLCINTAISPNITHTTTGATGISNDGVSGANGLPAGVSAHWAANIITISGTATASGTFNYSIPLTGGCGVVNATGTITVTPNNTVTAGTTTTLCINTAISPNITHTTTGATGIANDGVSGANGLPAGVSAHWAANTITISGTPTASGTFNYSIPLTGGCGVVNATGTITVTPANTTGLPSSTPTLCINTALSPSITIATTGATGISNDGVSGANGLPAGVSAHWSANIITISGTATASGTFNYSIPLTGGCGVVNATGTITVTPNNTVTAGTTTTLCINTAISPNITHTTTGATGISNDGVSGANGLPAGVSAHWAANTITISGTATASGTFNYSIPLTGGCGVVSATGTITVTAANTAGLPSSTPTLCINTALSPSITIATTGATGISNDGVSEPMVYLQVYLLIGQLILLRSVAQQQHREHLITVYH